MADTFQSLYRRYRPQRFSQLRGQDHVVLALRHAVRDERVAHAYLFSGPRGTGKTSMARILAKALNCTALKDGEPCGECDSCVGIARGISLDVHELDAASNNGVDAMRDLVGRAALATPGKWKVYIVDEVHMLSTAAANALLKTLEEPPSHVVFVLATTDPQKVLPTIKSRTQHFEFHLFDTEVLSALLSDIAADAQLDLPADGIEAAVRRGHGSARDALSALDQVAASGIVGDETRFVGELIAAIAESDTTKALQAVAGALVSGLDTPRLAAELIEGLRAVFLSAVAPSVRATIRSRDPESSEAGVGPDGRPLLGPARSVRALEVIGHALVDMREALDARTCFEVALVKLTHPEVDDSPAALVDRLDRLERRVSDLATAVAAVRGGAAPSVAGTTPAPQPVPALSTLPASPPASPPLPAPAGATAPRPDGGTPALGAFKRPVAAGPPVPRPLTSNQDPASESPERLSSPAARGQGAPQASSSATPLAPGLVPSRPLPTEPSPTGQRPDPAPAHPGVAGPLGATSGAPLGLPSRDDLTQAWGDHILSTLRPKLRAAFTAGHFVQSQDDVAVFSLPNSAHVNYAEPLRVELESVLAAYFKRPVPMRILSEQEPPPSSGVGARPAAKGTTRRGSSPSPARPAASDSTTDDDEEYESLEDLQPGEAGGTHDPVSWAATRLLEAFPGAEEIS